VPGRWEASSSEPLRAVLGAIFLYELASDPRTAGRFAGYAPVVGSPHAGFNAPPLHPPAAFFGVWGERDTTVPPAAANASDGVAVDTSYAGGWRYTAARAVTARWAEANGCRPEPQPLGQPHSWGGRGCVGYQACAGGSEVVECVWGGGGHDAPPWAEDALLHFMRRHVAHASRLPPPRPSYYEAAQRGGLSAGDAAEVALIATAVVALAAAAAACVVRCHRRRRQRQALLSSLSQRGISVGPCAPRASAGRGGSMRTASLPVVAVLEPAAEEMEDPWAGGAATVPPAAD